MTQHARWLALLGLVALAGCQHSSESTTTTTTGTSDTSMSRTSTPTTTGSSETASGMSAGAKTETPAMSSETAAKEVTTSTGLKYVDVVVGTGAVAENGKTVAVHYTGWLTDGTKFDSSVDRGDPIKFNFDGGMVIKGWDIGLSSMKVGGKRRIIIPANLAYGDGDHGPIPGGSILVFDVELMEAEN